MAGKIDIRPWEWSDSSTLTRLINNRNIWNKVRDLLPHPYTAKDADIFLHLSISAKYPTNFAITLDGDVVGGIGYIPKEDVHRFSAEIGYWVGEPFWGMGVATAGIGLLVKKIKKQSPHIIRIYAEVFAQNSKSIRALERNGFQLESVRKKSVVKNGIVMDDHVYVLIPENNNDESV